MRVGILGGSFDPVHTGHLAVATASLGAARLDRVEFVVSASPPHKRDGCRAPFADRVAMAHLATTGHRSLGVLDLEGDREGPSFTFYTVTELSRRWPEATLALLVGADMLADLPSWHRAGELVQAVEVVAFQRPGFDTETAFTAFRGAFPGHEPLRIPIPAIDVSSTDVRRRLARGLPVANLVDPQVADYIAEKGLYQAESGG